ncbi:MAG: ribonuclease, partial [Planctomycetota bacterium]
MLVAPAAAGPYDPPANYYNTATGTGSLLKSQLHNIIDNHTSIGYTSNRDELKDLDTDPNNSSRFLLVYDRQSLP